MIYFARPYLPTKNLQYLMKLFGMAGELTRQMQVPDTATLSFEERLSFLVDMEMTSRENRRLSRLLKGARLRDSACIEDIDFRAHRGLERSVILSLATCDWIEKRRNVLITGPTGVGKTFVVCALAHTGCRQGHPAIYYRSSRLFR
ncbi:MAG: hypothetical protein AUK32_02280 [Candidatus Aquicultor secundus]|nr:MAG: hypothetical protein AUK32_02280 [Candidatus Aquicultor secundus]